MALPLTYNFRNVLVRWRATLTTILGIGLVVAVFVLVQALAVGLEKSAGNTGDPRNVMIVRKGSTAESTSQVTLAQFQIIRYWEQIARDARIATLYEGTTGIQALDLLGRKVLLASRGRCVRDFTATMWRFAKPHLLASGSMGTMARALSARALQWNVLTTRLMLRARTDREAVGAASVDYLMYSGYVMMAFFWARQAASATALLANGKGVEEANFYRAKQQTATFYFERLLPRADAHRKTALASTRSVMQIDAAHFAFD